MGCIQSNPTSVVSPGDFLVGNIPSSLLRLVLSHNLSRFSNPLLLYHVPTSKLYTSSNGFSDFFKKISCISSRFRAIFIDALEDWSTSQKVVHAFNDVFKGGITGIPFVTCLNLTETFAGHNYRELFLRNLTGFKAPIDAIIMSSVLDSQLKEPSTLFPSINATFIKYIEICNAPNGIDCADLLVYENLESCEFVYAELRNIAELKKLKRFTRMVLPVCRFNHSEFSSLINLQHLDFTKASVPDVIPFASLLSLKYLDLHASWEINDISLLKDLVELEYLNIKDCSVSDISVLSQFSKLRDLTIYRTQVRDLSPISGLIGLSVLDAFASKVDDVSPLLGLIYLRSLDLGHTLVTDFRGLAALTRLEKLELRGTAVEDISFVSNLRKLSQLGLASTKIVNLSPLSNIVSLKHLDLSDTQVVDVSPLANLINLEFLALTNVPISDISSLASLKALVRLDLTGTSVDEAKRQWHLTQPNIEQLFL
ncbi:hypothetical protein RCL1_001793 [Eukaryota sp. TZLM3-RCL]